MGIESPIIDAVTYDRLKVPNRDFQPILVSQITPGQSGNALDDDGNVVSVTRSADYEGQCMIHWRAGSGGAAIFEMYAVVSFGGSLVWAKVDFTRALNSRNEPWNPMGRN